MIRRYFNAPLIKQIRTFHQKIAFDVKAQGHDIHLTPINCTPAHTLIWMHGLGDSAMGFLGYFNRRDAPIPATTKIVLLTASAIPITLNGGETMPA